MRIRDIMRLSWDQVRRRKVVTGLCAAGISIGCAAIIVALSVGESAQVYANKELNDMLKMDEITVYPNTGVSAGKGAPSSIDPQLLEQGKLTRQKLQIIRQLPHVTAAAPFRQVGYVTMTTADKATSQIEIFGTDLESLTNFGHTYMQGNNSDSPYSTVLNYGGTLGLMDEETRTELFARLNKDPYNQDLYNEYREKMKLPRDMYQKQVNFQVEGSNQKTHISSPIQVTGVLKKPANANENNLMYDKKAYVSMETAVQLMKELAMSDDLSSADIFDSVTVKVDNPDHIAKVEAQIKRLTLSTQNNLRYKDELTKQFAIVKMVALGIGVFILVIASISIIVAMTMSTHQRRRQIGIMKVLGANLRQIRNMFIVEAALLGLLGGFIGALFSYWIIWGINALVKSMSNAQEGMLFIPVASVLTGVAFAILTGVLSGIYPAVSASRTDALTAIRRD